MPAICWSVVSPLTERGLAVGGGAEKGRRLPRRPGPGASRCDAFFFFRARRRRNLPSSHHAAVSGHGQSFPTAGGGVRARQLTERWQGLFDSQPDASSQPDHQAQFCLPLGESSPPGTLAALSRRYYVRMSVCTVGSLHTDVKSPCLCSCCRAVLLIPGSGPIDACHDTASDESCRRLLHAANVRIYWPGLA